MKIVKLTDQAYDLVMSLVECELEDALTDSDEYIALDDLATQLDAAQD